jgi:hypothetical protein
MHRGAVRREGATKDVTGIAMTLRSFSVQELQRVAVAKELGHLFNFGSSSVELHPASSEGDRACLHLVSVNAVSSEGLKKTINALLHCGAEPLRCISAMMLGKGVIARRKQRRSPTTISS